MTNEQELNELNLPSRLVSNYLYALVNRFYKILPMKESGEQTLTKYISSLKREMIGSRELMRVMNSDGRILSLLATLEYLENHHEETAASDVKTEVFKSIDTIKQLRRQYGTGA